MNKPNPGGFEEVIAKANQMAQGPIASPFGVPQRTLGRGPQIPIRQTTQVFYLPRDAASYDEQCNMLWAGGGEIRFEERTWTKEGELAITLCHFTEAQPQRPPQAEPGGGGAEEVEVRPYRIP